MTFYEAAVEVLRRSGRPLHFKKITEVAIRDALLGHIGKTPETTMEDRLDLESKKADNSWIVRTRPGVYMLRGEIAERLNNEAAEREAEEQRRREEEAERARQLEEDSDSDDSDAYEDDSDGDDSDDDEDHAEDASSDDDDDDDSDDASEESSDEPRGRRRRRRGGRGRSRRSRRSSEDGDDAVSDADVEPHSEHDGDDDDHDDDEDHAEEGHSEDGDDDEHDGSRSRRRSRGRGRGRGRRRNGKKSDDAASFDNLDGGRCDSIADAAYVVLQANARKAMRAAEVAEIVFDKKLVKFHTHDPEVTIESAIVTDNQVRERSGRRPLFAAYREGRWGLTEWGVTDDGIDKEKQVLKLAASLREDAHEQLGEAIARLKPEAFEMVVMTLLERLGYHNLKVSKRTSDGDTYFSADWRRGFSDMRVCVCVIGRVNHKLEQSAITELRETLEHYSAAEGTVVHMGEIAKGAIAALRDESKAKVSIIDRKALVRLLVEQGIGVRTFQAPLVMVDTAFIDALQR